MPIFVIGTYKCSVIEIGAWGTYFVWVRIILILWYIPFGKLVGYVKCSKDPIPLVVPSVT